MNSAPKVWLGRMAIFINNKFRRMEHAERECRKLRDGTSEVVVGSQEGGTNDLVQSCSLMLAYIYKTDMAWDLDV